MKPNAHILATSILVTVLSGASHADVMHSGSVAAIGAGSSGGGIARSDAYLTGFEVADGFEPGEFPQGGWSPYGAVPSGASVSDAHPDSGSQHLRIRRVPGAPLASATGAYSPELGAQPPGRFVLRLRFASNDRAGADYEIIPESGSQGLLSARMVFKGSGDIMVLDDVGAGLTLVDTGANWVAGGKYRTIKIILDSVADTIDYYYNGSLIHSSVSGVFAGTTIEQIAIEGRNFNDSGNWGDFDDLSLTLPAPGALTLIGFCALVPSRRPRRA